MHTPTSSTQREALINCTNVTTEPTYNNPKPVLPALFKRSRPGADDGSARLKKLKFSIGESRTGKEKQGDSADESEEDSDSSSSSSITYCTARRKRTIFQAKYSLAMSRPGVTCRSLPCEPSFSWHHLVIDNRSADPLTPPRLRILSQDRRVHVQFGQGRLVLDTTIRLRIHQWCVSLLGARVYEQQRLIVVISCETWRRPQSGRCDRTGHSVHLGHIEARSIRERLVSSVN